MTDRRFIEETFPVKEGDHSARRGSMAQSPMVALFPDTRPEAEAVLEATPHELRRRLAGLLLDPDLAARVYGPLEAQRRHDAHQNDRPQL